MIVTVRLAKETFVPQQDENLIKEAATWVQQRYGRGFEFNRVENGHWYRTRRTWHFVKGQIIFKKD